MSNKNKKAKQKQVTIRHDTNPFITDLIIQTEKRSVKISKLGRDNNILINQDTGEYAATYVSSYRKVDPEKFVKVFSQHIALTFDLTAAGIKTFNVLIYAVQDFIGKDKITLDQYTYEDFLIDHPKIKIFSIQTFRRGLAELEKAQIIAKARKKGDYFINPRFIFNGDRIAFQTIIEKDSK